MAQRGGVGDRPHQNPPAAEVPLGVWPVAQTSAQYQRAGRYLPACTAHPAKMLPDLARRIVAEYSAPGDLVVDPMAGTATTIVEAATAARRGVGVEVEARWADLARANLDHVLDPTTRPLARVITGDARALPTLLGELTGRVDLVATSPPYHCDAGVIDKTAWAAGRRLCVPESLNYSTDRANLGHARGNAYASAMAEIYTACYTVLRPGGLMVTVTKNTRRGGRCFDLAALTVALARAAGFCYIGHVVALLAAVRDARLCPRPSFWALTQHRRARAAGQPAHLVAHEDVLVFSKPPKGVSSAKPNLPGDREGADGR